MKYFSLIVFFVVLSSCITTKKYKSISVTKFLNNVDVDFDCKEKKYYWKKDHALLDGVYKLKCKSGSDLIESYLKGILKRRTEYYRKEETCKIFYSNSGSYIKTVYSERANFSLITFDESYDSASYCFDNYFLQKITYYKQGKEFKTVINYGPGYIKVKSITDKFYTSELCSRAWGTECAYDSLMIDKKTGRLYNEIKIDVETPSDKYCEFYTLKDNGYQWTVK